MRHRNLGRYRLIDRIAVGGTAEVHLAVLETTEGFAKTVAIKMLLPQWVDNEELARLLVDEARVLCHLNHRSIVQVYELGEEGGVPFMAIEYVDGIDCARLMNAAMCLGRPLPAGLGLHIVSQVLQALDFAHTRKDERGGDLSIVHRDVSPSNILISRNGEVKITDFGIAKGSHRTQSTDAGQRRGKYAYMSPEQARGEHLDCRSDVFSCGVVLFELLSARRLFAGRSELEVLRNVSEGRVDLSRLDGMPSCIRSLLMRSLEADVSARFQSAEEMLGDIAAAAAELCFTCASSELAAFVRTNFPNEGPPYSGFDVVQSSGAKRTHVMMAYDAQRVRRTKTLHPFAAGCRVVASLFLVLGVLATHPASGSMPISSDMRGVIAIDSDPPGVRGNLELDGRSFPISTPFSLGDIDLKDAVEGRFSLSAPGYQEHAETFALSAASSAFVRNVSLMRASPSNISIAARPWGLASIEGYVTSRETPIASVKVKPGSHLVTVLHPPSGQRFARRVAVGKGESKRCAVDFGTSGLLRCW